MRLHLVDGTYELFRAHHSGRPSHTDAEGRDNRATLGVVDSLISLISDPGEGVTHLGVAFDHPIESFRNALLPSYKDGTGVEPVLLAQFDEVERAVAALGVTVWAMDEHEADDALATVARALADSVDQVRVHTPDKDLAQAVRGTRIVQVDRARRRAWDEAGVVERLGVPPTSVPDLLALVGDASDGIPGLPGFGAVGAARVLAHYHHLEAIPTDGPWVVPVRGAARLAATLGERIEEARLYRRVATVADTGQRPRLADLEWRGPDLEAFATWCEGARAPSLLARAERLVVHGSDLRPGRDT